MKNVSFGCGSAIFVRPTDRPAQIIPMDTVKFISGHKEEELSEIYFKDLHHNCNKPMKVKETLGQIAKQLDINVN
ncbi:MAG: hypothetical protein A2Y25_10685 [Candidatus Melainabacteria bacterium GWF2_37_15]|nr:MAG: hypothetical protein A2Y25_10685 [Candidatus Melainabacteria bacterium GWF2_37_15]